LVASIKVECSNEERYSILAALRLEDKVADGYLEKRVENHPGLGNRLPEGTVSQIVRYIVKHNNWMLVKAHQYMALDGRIFGGPDPKYIRLNDVVLVQLTP